MSTREEYEARIAELEKEVRHWIANHDCQRDKHRRLSDRHGELWDQFNAMKADALRYRWLRQKVHGDGEAQLDAEIGLRQPDGGHMDAYIDVALSQEPAP